MKIAIIANGYPDNREPQLGCFEKDQAKALKEAGHDVAILYVDKRFRTYWRKIGFSIFESDGIDVFGVFYMPMQWLRKLPFFGLRLHYWAASRALERVYCRYEQAKGKPDIIYAHFMYNIAYATYLKKKHDVLLVGMEHWSILNQPTLTPQQVYWGIIAYNGVDKLLAVSESLRVKIKEHFDKESTVIYNMIGEEFLQQSPSKIRHDGVLKIVSTGSLIPRKGYDVLLKSLKEVAKTSNNWYLTIVGDGQERNNLLEMIRNYHLEKNVNLVGRKSKTEIIEILHQSDVFVLASRAENFSVAVLEALSAGLPVIATICGGIRECIDGENGLLVSVDDVQALASAIIQMIDTNQQYDRRAISEKCRKKYSPQVIVEQLTNVFINVNNK